MNGDTSLRLRALLLQHPEGLDIGTISKTLQREYTNVAKRLHATYGCYVLRWEGQRQIWTCMPIPENAPRPPYVRKPYTPFKPKRQAQGKTLDRVSRAEPLTQDVLDAAPCTRSHPHEVMSEACEARTKQARQAAKPYKPQKTVWQYVKPWPKEPE
jgi:hypothetical protein